MLHVAERGLKLAEFKFAQAAERGCRRGVWNQVEVMRERVGGLREIVGAVTKLAEIPPAIRPGRIDAESLSVEFGGADNVPGLTCGIRVCGELVEAR